MLIDRSYIDTQSCYMELPIHLANNGFKVDLYMPFSTNNHQPFFQNQAIRVLPFPDSAFQKADRKWRTGYGYTSRHDAIFYDNT